MKECPINFTTPMVKAILEDRKTQTRRVIKFTEPFSSHNAWLSIYPDGGGNWIAWSYDEPGLAEFTKKAYPNGEGFKCPYGTVGDRLWVRETWVSQDFCICNESDLPNVQDKITGGYHTVIHKAGTENYAWGLSGEPKWKSGRFMFKRSARLWLEITNIKVERLQNITCGGYKSKSDVQKEGCPFPTDCETFGEKEIQWFIHLWDSINAKRGYSWQSNPWVWCLSFKKLEF